jgi:hypothetical protein
MKIIIPDDSRKDRSGAARSGCSVIRYRISQESKNLP